MSTKLINDVIDNCGIDFNDCNVDVNDQCILKVTLKCFKQMIKNALPVEQSGGGSLNIKSIFPYMTAYNIDKLTGNTIIPVGILSTLRNSPIPRGLKFDDEAQVNSVLNNVDIKYLNSLRLSKPTI